MRSILLAASLAASLVLAGCGISTSSSAPLVPAPTPGPSEAPRAVIGVGSDRGDLPLSLRIYDRAFSLTNARSATIEELADVEALDGNAVGVYQGAGREILVTWAGSQCLQSGDLFIGPGVDEIVIAPAAVDCADGPNVRGVVLEFTLAVDLAAFQFDLRPRVAV